MDTFTKVMFPEYMDLRTVALIRMFIALSIWFVTIHMILSKGWTQQTTYQKGSQLIMAPIVMSGAKTLAPFTSISWILLGISFTLSSYIALKGVEHEKVAPWILRIALCVWEVAAPNSLLVASVIRYAIWPAVLAKGNVTDNLKSWRNVFMHNINVFYALTETALLGGLPVRWSDISLAPLVGLCYVIFSWNMTMVWNKPHGPQFIYYFFDTTLPGYQTTISLLVLLVALLLFFVLFCASESLLKWMDGGIVGSLAFVVVICSGVMRFRD
ncbi:hypothetical protein ACA910_017083 [Epithemia clementina (nom. ined.)]